MHTVGTWWMWLGFFGLIAFMLWVDIVAMKGGKSHRVSLKEAGTWSLIWVSVALLFNAALWWYLDVNAGREVANHKGLEFLTGYLIEKSLAVDNVFVWLMIFNYFHVPLALQRRVLLFGVAGAIILRTIMIFLGAWLISQFHWILYLFGLFLLVTGVKMLFFADKPADLADNGLLRWMRRNIRISDTLEGENFLTRKNGLLYATPLLLVLVLVEISDVVFAVDSIPAIFAVTTDPFIVLTSNIFAILGLRAMYFLLADFADRFSMLKYGLGLILVFIGAKMLIVDVFKVPVLLSLLVVVTILAGSVIWSLLLPAKTPSTQPKEEGMP